MPSDLNSGSAQNRLRRTSAPDGKRAARRGVKPGSTADTLLRWLWFEVLNFAESYKLQTLAIIFFWMFVVWILGANLIWVMEQWLPTEALQQKSLYFGPENYFDTYWWVINAIMSAGVEDSATPQSLGARTVAVIVVVLGLCLVTVFTGNVVAILWERIARRDLMRVKPRIAHVGQYWDHVVICNISNKFEPILRQIVEKAGPHTKVVLVDPKAGKYRTDRRQLFRSTFGVAGNPQSLRVLKRADVAAAAALVILTPDTPGQSLRERDYQALLTALAVQPIAQVNPNLRIILEVGLKSTLEFAGIFNALTNYPLYIEAVCADDFQEKLLSQACLTPGLSHLFDLLLTVPPERRKRPAVTRFFDTIFLREAEAEETPSSPIDTANDVRAIPVPGPLVGRTFRHARQEIEEADGVTVIGYLEWEGSGEGVGIKRPVVTLNPSRRPPAPGETAPVDHRLSSEDELFVIARPEACATLREGRFLGNRVRASTHPTISRASATETNERKKP